MAEMCALLVRYYGISAEGAAEVVQELRDKRSLQSLAAGYRVARAVPVPSPNDLLG